jgi:hypothetical protein
MVSLTDDDGEGGYISIYSGSMGQDKPMVDLKIQQAMHRCRNEILLNGGQANPSGYAY